MSAVDLGIPAPVAPGEGWTCAEGKRHFVCYLCHEVFTSQGTVIEPAPDSEDGDEDEGTFSVCDDCSEIVMARARAAGLI